MCDEKRRHDHGGDVERGAKQSRLDLERNALVIRIEKIYRAPDVKERDEWNGQRPAPRQCRDRKKRQDRGAKITPRRGSRKLGSELRGYDSGKQEAQSHEPECVRERENFQRVVSWYFAQRRLDVEGSQHPKRHERTGYAKYEYGVEFPWHVVKCIYTYSLRQAVNVPAGTACQRTLPARRVRGASVAQRVLQGHCSKIQRFGVQQLHVDRSDLIIEEWPSALQHDRADHQSILVDQSLFHQGLSQRDATLDLRPDH